MERNPNNKLRINLSLNTWNWQMFKSCQPKHKKSPTYQVPKVTHTSSLASKYIETCGLSRPNPLRPITDILCCQIEHLKWSIITVIGFYLRLKRSLVKIKVERRYATKRDHVQLTYLSLQAAFLKGYDGHRLIDRK